MYNGCFENIRLRCTDITGGFGFRRTKVRLKEIKKFRGWIDKLFQIIKQDDRNVEDFGGYSMQFVTAISNLLL